MLVALQHRDLMLSTILRCHQHPNHVTNTFVSTIRHQPGLTWCRFVRCNQIEPCSYCPTFLAKKMKIICYIHSTEFFKKCLRIFVSFLQIFSDLVY